MSFPHPLPGIPLGPTIDWSEALTRAQALPAPDRLLALLHATGCESHALSPRLIRTSAVRLWCLGGLPVAPLIARGVSPNDLVNWTNATMGTAGSLSYLTMPGGQPETAYRKIVGEVGHHSVAHLVQVSLVVAGVSCAVENEFNSQRDLVHLARVTEARTDSQKAPPVVVLEPSLAVPVHQAMVAIDRIVAAASTTPAGHALSRKDANEALNLLFPAAKATLFVMTGTLRNLQKLLAAETDDGKEKEYRRVLGQVRQTLSPWWPLLFPKEAA